MSVTADPSRCGAPRRGRLTVARNVSTRYLAIAVETALGLVVLPFNVAHLGTSAYGLWMLAASVTAYFSVLDLGYSGALVKFVAQYRARRDFAALNEILSTMFFVFTALRAVTYVVGDASSRCTSGTAVPPHARSDRARAASSC